MLADWMTARAVTARGMVTDATCASACTPASVRPEPWTRAGSPLILGVGQGETFLASDAMALAGVTDQIVYLEEGDVVDIQLGKYWVVDREHKAVTRAVKTDEGEVCW